MNDKLEKLTAQLTAPGPTGSGSTIASQTTIEVAEPSGRFSLRDLWRLLQARKAIVAGATLAALLAAAFYNYATTPTYLATATLQIDREQPNIARLDDEFSRLPERPDYIETQYKILQSRTLARRVIERLELESIPELTRGLERGVAGGAEGRAQAPSSLGAALDDPARAEAIPRPIVDAFLERLRIDPGKGTRLVDVSFESEQPRLAAAVSNALAEEYIEHNLEAKWNATQKASRWLEQQLISLQDALEASESALHGYAARHSILFVEERKDITTEKLARLENELTAAQAERIDKQSLAMLVEDAVRGGGQLPAQVTNPPLEELRNKRVELRRELEKLRVTFGPAYPRVVRVQRELDEVERSIDKENERLLARVRESHELARGREGLLLEAAQRQRRLVNRLSDDFIQYDILKREAESNRQLYEGLLQRLKEAGVSAGLRASNIAVLDAAELPERPFRPRKLLNLLMALFCGSMLGVMGAFAAEHLNTRVRTPDEVEHLTGLDLLAVLPKRREIRQGLQARLRVAGRSVSVSLSRPRSRGAVLLSLLSSSNGVNGKESSVGSDSATSIPAAARNGKHADGRSFVARSALLGKRGAILGLGLDQEPERESPAFIPLVEAGSATPSPGVSTGLREPAKPVSDDQGWDAEAGLSEAYRTLRSSILLGWDGGLRRLLITSSQPQEGKTTVSLNLACSLAQLGHSVLLVDADMRRPNCARQLGLAPDYGLSSFLRGEVDFDTLVTQTPVKNLALVHAGSAEAFASDLLCSPRLAQLLDEAARRYDHILIDSPPALALSDGRTISRYVEGVMLVVSDQTDRSALLRTQQTFNDAGGRLVGFVMNRVDLADLDYDYYHHYGYYHASGAKGNG